MDPQDPTTPAVPDRPLTRRELRERERAQQEAAQRLLTPQRRASSAPDSAFPRSTTAPAAETSAPASTPPDRPSAPPAAPTAAAPANVQPDRPTVQRPDDGSAHATPHGRRRARTAEPLQPAAYSAGPLTPTSAAMGWGSYPPSSGPTASSYAAVYAPPSPITVPDSGAPSVLPSPVPAARASLDVAAPAPVADPQSPHAPSSAATGDSALAEATPATAYLPTVPTVSEEAPIRRNVFPAAAQAFAHSAVAAPAHTPPAHAEPVHEPTHHWGFDDAPADYDDAFEFHDGLQHPTDLHHDNAFLHHDNAFAAPVDHAHEADLGHHPHSFDDAHAVFGEPVAAKPRRSRRLRVTIGLTLAFALFVGAALIGVQFLKPILGIDKVKDFPGPGTGSVTVTVQPGSGAAAVASTLEKQDVIADAGTFLKAFAAAGGSLHPGDYTFKKEMKSSDAAQVLVGTSNDKVIYFALSAGMRVGESLDAIAKAASVDRKDLDALSAKPTDFGLPAKAKNLEGYLAPGEYRFPVGTSAKDILTKLVTTTLDKLKADGITDPSKQYDVLTVASIVQAEGGRADYGNVAGAIYNRLKPNTETNGYIQSDATVTYGLGKKSYHITEDEKADKSNPYNTYANPGLPAGPIGSPGASAIDAAAKPTPNDYLYWVTVNLDTGETKFSKTYAEHQVYAQQYEQWCQANAGKCQ